MKTWTKTSLGELLQLKQARASLAEMAERLTTSRPEVAAALDYLKYATAAEALACLNARAPR